MLTKSIIIFSINLRHWLLCACLFSIALPAVADPLPTPTGRVLLVITGNIGVTNSGTNSAMGQADQAEFDLALLDSLPQHEFRTETPWSNGEHLFSGVLLKDLLSRVEAKSPILRAVAFNEYFSEVDTRLPGLDKLLLTTRLDGEPMRIRDKGPTWLMLPLTDMKELNNKRYHELMIWQIRTLDVQ